MLPMHTHRELVPFRPRPSLLRRILIENERQLNPKPFLRTFLHHTFVPFSCSPCRPYSLVLQLFFSYFKELVGKQVTVELKNELAITGYLHSVDQYLNIKLVNCRVVDEVKYPHMVRDFRQKPQGCCQVPSATRPVSM